MSSFGGFGIPGQGALVETSEREILWGGDAAIKAVLHKSSIISGAARDAGNTPTTVLRPGLLMGVVTSTGELEEWDAGATDGTQNIATVLWKELRAQDFDANNTDRAFTTLLRAPLLANRLLIQGSSLVGHTDEYLARRQLHLAGFILDDDPWGYKAGVNYRTLVKASDYTVVASDNGTYFTTRGAAAAVSFTLPALQRGLEFQFFNEVGQNMTVVAATADTMVVFNDLTADSIAFSTSSEVIGAKVKVRANDDASKWLVEVNLGSETQTPTIAT